MNVTYFSKYSDAGPSSRFRAFQFAEHFAHAGVPFDIQVLFDDRYFDILRMPSSLSTTLHKSRYVLSRFEERRKALRRTGESLCIIEQQLFPYLPFLLEKPFLPSTYLVEFDDAIYLTHPGKLRKVCRNAAGVLAGNRTLAGYASQYNRQVHLVPTVLNTDLFRPMEKSQSEKIRIGWSGIEYNFHYMRALSPVFLSLQKLYPVEIVILAGSSPVDFSFPFRFVKWDRLREIEQMNQFDIGVMPLAMDEWSKGKCGLKLLQYMSLEIPSVATPIGVNTEIIREGVNGFTAITHDEWEERLAELIRNEMLRRQMGKAARETVLENYSLKMWFPRILKIYESYA